MVSAKLIVSQFSQYNNTLMFTVGNEALLYLRNSIIAGLGAVVLTPASFAGRNCAGGDQ